MPPTINSKKTTSRTREGIKRRGNKKRPGRKPVLRSKAHSPRVIANSIFALTNKPKPAIAVSMIHSGKKSPTSYLDEDYGKMYHDILKCAQRAILLATGDVTTFDPLKQGFDLSESFDFVFKMLKRNVIPKDWEYNIEQD